MLCSLFAKITEKYNDLKEKIYKAKRKMHQYFHINARGRRKKKKHTNSHLIKTHQVNNEV